MVQSYQVFQHADYQLSLPSFRANANNSGRRKQGKLPVSYTDIHPTVLRKLEPPVSWHLLPLIAELVTATATMRHAANMVKAITENVNPGQPVVITANQPVYAFGKQLQWIFPDEFRDCVWMLGPLHIKRNFIKVIGDWSEWDGWTNYKYSSNTSPGKAGSFLSCAGAAGIKRSRFAHQVSLAALVTLANEASFSSTIWIPELQRLERRPQKKICNCNVVVYCDWAWNVTLFICA